MDDKEKEEILSRVSEKNRDLLAGLLDEPCEEPGRTFGRREIEFLDFILDFYSGEGEIYTKPRPPECLGDPGVNELVRELEGALRRDDVEAGRVYQKKPEANKAGEGRK